MLDLLPSKLQCIRNPFLLYRNSVFQFAGRLFFELCCTRQLALVTDANVLDEPPEHFDPEGEGILSHAPIGLNLTPGFRLLSNAR